MQQRVESGKRTGVGVGVGVGLEGPVSIRNPKNAMEPWQERLRGADRAVSVFNSSFISYNLLENIFCRDSRTKFNGGGGGG